MSNAKNVLVVTDYTGNLHITPLGNKPFYQSRNKLVRDKQFKFRDDMTEAQAEEFVKKHNGKDPSFVNLSKADQVIAEKNNEIEKLKQQLAALQGGGSDEGTGKKTAKEVIAEIKAATSADEVNALIEGEERPSVLQEAQKKIASFIN